MQIFDRRWGVVLKRGKSFSEVEFFLQYYYFLFLGKKEMGFCGEYDEWQREKRERERERERKKEGFICFGDNC
jgi:hypothetical protein